MRIFANQNGGLVREGAFSVVDERYLIGEEGKGIVYVKDRLRMRFLKLRPTLRAIRKAGLKPEPTKDLLMPGRKLIVATRP